MHSDLNTRDQSQRDLRMACLRCIVPYHVSAVSANILIELTASESIWCQDLAKMTVYCGHCSSQCLSSADPTESDLLATQVNAGVDGLRSMPTRASVVDACANLGGAHLSLADRGTSKSHCHQEAEKRQETHDGESVCYFVAMMKMQH